MAHIESDDVVAVLEPIHVLVDAAGPVVGDAVGLQDLAVLVGPHHPPGGEVVRVRADGPILAGDGPDDPRLGKGGPKGVHVLVAHAAAAHLQGGELGEQGERSIEGLQGVDGLIVVVQLIS